MKQTAKEWILKQRLENYGYDWREFNKMSQNKARLKSKIRQMSDADIRRNLAKAGILGGGGRLHTSPIHKKIKGKWKKTSGKNWDYDVGQSYNEELMNILHIGIGKKTNWWSSQRIW